MIRIPACNNKFQNPPVSIFCACQYMPIGSSRISAGSGVRF